MNLLFAAAHVVGAAGAAAIGSQDAGIITTEVKTTAAGAQFGYNISSGQIGPNSVVFASIQNGTNSAGTPVITSITTAIPGQTVITVQNIHATNAFNGTFIISVFVLN